MSQLYQNSCITTDPRELDEGLFGQVLLWVAEILPFLKAKGLRPQWDIRSRHYGLHPDYRVIPGVLDLAYPPDPVHRHCSLSGIRLSHTHVIGGDWQGVHDLWSSFFRIPKRLIASADALDLPPETLGIHYRGTDKLNAWRDTNPVSREDLQTLLDEFLEAHSGIQAIFVASDEASIVDFLARRYGTRKVVSTGPAVHHKNSPPSLEKADGAMLDCVALSRCRHVIKTSSALSAFAKVLTPQLDCYRIAACKMFGEVPYFPDAYIPRLQSESKKGREVLSRLFSGDWMDDPRVPDYYRVPFLSIPRYTNQKIWINHVLHPLTVARHYWKASQNNRARCWD